MGIFSSYLKGYSDNMLGPQAPGSEEQNSGKMNRFMQSLGAAQANKSGGSRTQYQAPDVPMSQAFQQMQSGMNKENAGGELDAMFADEASGATESSYVKPTAKERRDQQIQAMITSGNSVLSGLGLDMYSKGAEKGPNSWQEYNLGVDNEGYADYLASKKGGVTIENNLGDKNQFPKNASDIKGWTYPNGDPVRMGTPWQEIYDRKGSAPKNKFQTDSGTGADLIEENLDLLYDNIDAESQSTAAGYLAEARNSDDWYSKPLDAAMNFMGKPQSQTQVQFNAGTNMLATQIGKLMSGAEIPVTEMKKFKDMQPAFGDPVHVRKQKYNNSLKFAESLLSRAGEAGVEGLRQIGTMRRFPQPELTIPGQKSSVPPMLERPAATYDSLLADGWVEK